MEAGAGVARAFGVESAGPGGLSNRRWFLAALLLAAGGGILAEQNPRLALDIALLIVGFVLVFTRPLAVLVVVIAVASRHSPFIEIGVAASCVLLLPRLLTAPARPLLVPLALLLLFALPGLNFGGSQLSSAVQNTLLIPGVNVSFLTRPSPEVLAWLRLAYGLMLALLAALTATTVGRARLLFGTVLVTGAYPIIVGIQQMIGGKFVVKAGFQTVEGPFTFPNEFGFYLVIIVTLAVVGVIELRRGWLRIGSALIGLGGALMLQQTYTRAAWIGFAVAILIVAILQYRRLILVAVVLLAITAVAAPGSVREVQARFGDLASQNASTSGNSLTWRRGEWSRMIHYGTDHPLTGEGFGSYQRLTVQEFGTQSGTYSTIHGTPGGGALDLGFAAHNDYVKMYVETGVPGLVLWVATLLGAILTAVRALRLPALRPWAAAVVGLLVAFTIMSASDNIQAYAVPLTLVFTLTAALAAAHRAARASAPPSA